MNNQVKQRFSRRVADYFLVIGAGESLEMVQPEGEPSPLLKKAAVDEQVEYESSILSRYPSTDWPEFPLPEGIPLFCLPNGLVLSEPRSPAFHSFVHTSDDGTRILGSCLTVYEPLTESQRNSVSHSFSISGQALSEAATEIEESLSENDTSIGVSGDDRETKNRIAVHSSENVFVPLCICLISHLPFVQSFKAFLCELYRLSLVYPMPIPVERYICNFIDEVPSPPAGRVDVTYFIGERSITFRCPPSNQPNVWSGMPLFPVFECLSPENVLLVFALALTERQIVFVSSQYSLLTSCAEAVTSLLYPLSWTHAYIPILPRELLGVLGAPFPFMIGLHEDLARDCTLPTEAAVVYLDENWIHLGSLGAPPPLPSSRQKKLLQTITSAAPVFSRRESDWKEMRLSAFDTAFSSTSERALTVSVREREKDRAKGSDIASAKSAQSQDIDEVAIRAAFLNFFASILKGYKHNIIYSAIGDPDAVTKFNAEKFLAEQPADYRLFLEELTGTQMFTQFIDERSSPAMPEDRIKDITFFDESIDAKMNRYMFNLQKIDTPFLLDDARLHVKTFVPPSPNIENLPQNNTQDTQSIGVKSNRNHRFPRLNPHLFSAPRQISPHFEDGLEVAASYQLRLKRSKSKQQLQDLLMIRAPKAPQLQLQLPRSQTSSAQVQQLGQENNENANNNSSCSALTALSCVYSCYLVTVSRLICYIMSTIENKNDNHNTKDKDTDTSNSYSHSHSPYLVTGRDQRRYSTDGTGAAEQCDHDDHHRGPDHDHDKHALGYIQSRRPSSPTPHVDVKHDNSISNNGDTNHNHLSSVNSMSLTLTNDEHGCVNDQSNKHIVLRTHRSYSSGSNDEHRNAPHNEGGYKGGCEDGEEDKEYGHCEGDHAAHSQYGNHSNKSELVKLLNSREADAEAALLALKVCFEVLSSLSRQDEVPDDIVYRSLADACAACACPAEAMDLILHMTDEGFQPDNLILSAVGRAYSKWEQCSSSFSSIDCKYAHRLKPPYMSAAEMWSTSTQHWNKVPRDPSECSVYLRKRMKARQYYSAPLSTLAAISGKGSTGTGNTSVASALSAIRSSDPATGNSKSSDNVRRSTLPLPSPFPSLDTSTNRSNSISGTDNGGGNIGADVTGVTAQVALRRDSAASQLDVELAVAVTCKNPSTTSVRCKADRSPQTQREFVESRDKDARTSWSFDGESVLPELQWSHLLSPNRKPSFAISKRLNRHILVSERLLSSRFPGLAIDLASPLGASCPNVKCSEKGKPCSIGALYKGFRGQQVKSSHGSSSFVNGRASSSSHTQVLGDPNRYTTVCPSCGTNFVPRFVVRGITAHRKSSLGSKSDEKKCRQEDQLWCELLSPWALRKELFRVLFNDGVEALLGRSQGHTHAHAHTPSAYPTAHAVVFWNALVSFRLRGLPYAFLLCPADRIVEAFPAKSPDSPAADA